MPAPDPILVYLLILFAFGSGRRTPPPRPGCKFATDSSLSEASQMWLSSHQAPGSREGIRFGAVLLTIGDPIQVTTKSGAIVRGILEEATPEQITVLPYLGADRTFSRDDVGTVTQGGARLSTIDGSDDREDRPAAF